MKMRLQPFLVSIFVSLGCFSLTTCSLNHAKPTSKFTDLKPLSFSDDWQKQWWLNKLSRTLRFGKGLSSADPVDDLTQKPPLEAVRYFMNDVAFEKTLLDFHLYFLGMRLSVEGRERSLDRLTEFPQVVTAAREVLSGSNYLKFFEYQQPTYVFPNREPGNGTIIIGGPDDDLPPQPEESFSTQRAKIFAENVKDVNELIEYAQKNPNNRQEFCKLYREKSSSLSLQNYGLPRSLDSLLETDENWSVSLDIYCFVGDTQVDVVEVLKRVKTNTEKVLEVMKPFDPENYSEPIGVVGLKTAEPAQFFAASGKDIFSQDFWEILPNSSTNYNRKRGAYILKRYFCDDLTPIRVDIPSGHVGDRHASDPSCQSCHYKLDPIAGFFRERGIGGLSFTNSNKIVFDDRAIVDKERYQKSWKASPGSGRAWDVGYIRSTTDDSLNLYGTSLDDLGKILSTAREVKQCLVRRMFEYFVAENQALDEGYLSHLTEQFIDESKENSSDAFRHAVERLVTSHTFANPDATADQCYDYKPGDDLQNKPPCQVAYLFKQNCGSCHGADNPRKGLSLVRWERLANGQFGFPHVNAQGEQVPRSQTFERIYNRMLHTDEELQPMPPGQIVSGDREKLVLWTHKMMQETKQVEVKND